MKKHFGMSFKKQTLASVIAGLVLGAATGQALAATVSSTATATVTGHAPVLSPDGVISYTDNNGNGVLDTGDTVEISTPFTFTDSDGDTSIANTYSWKIDGTEVSTTDTYTIVAADLGKHITLEATPHTDPAITDPSVGVAVAAKADVTQGGTGTDLPIAAGDEVIAVAVTGNPVVGETLTATATCTTACGGKVDYQWQIEDAVGSGQFVDIAGANNSTYQPTKDDQRKAIRVKASNPATP